MKFIIIFEDENRTLIFKSNSREEVDEWIKRTIEKIKSKEGEVYNRDKDVAWGTNKQSGKFWKITVYENWEIDTLKDIVI